MIGQFHHSLWHAAVAGIVIPRNYYTSWWFIALVVLLVALAGWLVYVRHVRRLVGLDRAATLERERIARELHDTLLQSVQGLLLLIQATAHDCREQSTRDRLLRAVSAARATVVEGRAQVQSLRVTEPDIDLPARLMEVATQLSTVYKVAFGRIITGQPVSLSPAVAREVLPVLREMLTNAFQHSRAANIRLDLRYGLMRFEGTVTDDGIGMAPEVMQAGGRTGHWGLVGMRERVAQLHGQFRIDSVQGKGTAAHVSIPAQRLYRENIVTRVFRRRHGSLKLVECSCLNETAVAQRL
ncbi:sensor histidine kinase [Pinirhizobacter sp.]|uniref:sensor histidine kinase n=1 Tax=Pinirhizobacter sp. TaxID=2950432 RepID=UPI002F40D607